MGSHQDNLWIFFMHTKFLATKVQPKCLKRSICRRSWSEPTSFHFVSSFYIIYCLWKILFCSTFSLRKHVLKEKSGSNSASLTLALRNQQYQQAMSLWSGPNMAYMHQMRQMHPTPGLKGSKAFVCFHKGIPVETKQYLAMSWMLLFPEMLLLKLRLISIARMFLVGFICTTCLFSQGNTGENQRIYGNV